MRVVQVVADGRPGGGTVMVLALVEHLLGRGVATGLVTDAGSHAAARGRELGAEVAEIPFFSPLTASRRLSAELDLLRPEIVHAHGSRAGFHLAPWSSRHPTVATHYTVHGYHFHHRWWLRRMVGRWAERRAGRQLGSVVHVCDYDRKLAESGGLVARATPRRVIYNGVDTDALPPRQPPESPRVVFVGRLVPQKAPELIAAIASELVAAGLEVTIVGGGDKEAVVHDLLRSELDDGLLTLTGSVDRARALAELAHSSVLVLPSRWEGLPVVLLEALALGVPVVAASVGGVPEIVTSSAIGALVEERDPASFVRAVHRVLAGSEGNGGRRSERQRALKAFSLERCTRRYRELYGI
ncbi:MAG: glycosyltransferase family 4 protein [Acidobacteria bacterium]|nr:glycosyltransferase family 4 protein [Acidobacteriota bacterium]